MPPACAALFLLVVAMGVCEAQPPPAASAAPATTLRVATGQLAPFVLDENGTLSGFSIDLWQEIASRLKLEFVWVRVAPADEQLKAVARGDADVAIAAITMTPERERMVDFSTSYFDSGLQIMVPAVTDASFLGVAQAMFSAGIRQIALAALAVMFLLANVLWLVERRSNPNFQKGYVRGILEGLWGVVLIIATGEHGDRETPNVVKRLTVATMWLLGVVLIAQFTATVTSTLTVQRFHSSIERPGDLPGKRIATVPGSVAADYLKQLGIPFVEVTTADQGFEMLRRSTVQAIVFEAAALQYWAARRGKGAVEVVGPVFRPEKYGIAVARGNPLRKRINGALLAMYDDGKYEEIRSKWFASR